MDIAGYVDTLFSSSVFTSPEKLLDAIEEMGWDAISSDPAMKLSDQVNKIIVAAYPGLMHSDTRLAEGRKAYTAGLLEWKKGEPSYPDANFTMRLTYGTVKGYSPKDAVIYRYYTTLDGVMESMTMVTSSKYFCSQRRSTTAENSSPGTVTSKPGWRPEILRI